MFSYNLGLHWPEISVPLVPREEIATLYSFGHYDGPKTGLVRWKDELYYVFDFCIAEHDDRHYWLVRLTSAQQEYAVRYGATWQAFFTSAMAWTPEGVRQETPLGLYAVLKDKHIEHTAEGRARFEELFRERPEPEADAEICGYFIGWTL